MSTVPTSDYIGNDTAEELFSVDAGQAVDRIEDPVAVEDSQTIAEAQPAAIESPAIETSLATVATHLDDDRYFEQLDLLAKMADCERRRVEIASELAEAKEAVKDLNAQFKSCVIDMQEIASDIADLMANTYIPERKQFAADPAKIESDSHGQESETIVADWGDGMWREGKTAEVFEGVKGLGKKKLEALVDLAPTIGELEDLRGTSYGVFKNVLPQGFGDKVASEIEDRLIAYIAAHSTPPASEQVKMNAPATVVDDASEAVTLADVEGFVEQYRNDAEIEKWDERDCDLENLEFEASEGFQSFKNGESVSSFPATWPEDQLREWAHGYVCAEVMARISPAKDELPGQALKIANTGEFDDL